MLLCVASCFALVVLLVAVPRCLPREFGPAVRADQLPGLSRLLPLVPEKVAKRRKLLPVTSVLPALRLQSAPYHPDVVGCRRRRVFVVGGAGAGAGAGRVVRY